MTEESKQNPEDLEKTEIELHSNVIHYADGDASTVTSFSMQKMTSPSEEISQTISHHHFIKNSPEEISEKSSALLNSVQTAPKIRKKILIWLGVAILIILILLAVKYKATNIP